MPSLSRHRSNFKWGQYEQIRPLRKELYGKVCLARRGSETAVVKVSYKKLQSKFSRDPRSESSILRKLSDLSHPNIVHWLAEYEDENEYCMVLELCRGGNLYDWVTASRKTGVARSYFQQVAKGLSFLHQQGLCHLNLGLENLLLDKESVKIANFVYARPALHPLTVSVDTLPGHKQYMAPEVFNLGPFDGRKADMWSLGVILFALLTGVLPFQLPCASDPTFCGVTQGKVISELRVAPAATDLLSKLLSLSPASRPSAEDVLDHEWLLRV